MIVRPSPLQSHTGCACRDLHSMGRMTTASRSVRRPRGVLLPWRTTLLWRHVAVIPRSPLDAVLLDADEVRSVPVAAVRYCWGTPPPHTSQRGMEPVGEWIKRRGAEPWHLIADSPDRVAACGATEVDMDIDPVSWTDPDRYPPEPER